MRHYPIYSPSPDEIDDLIDSQRAVRLMTVAPNGLPRLGIYPFVRFGELLEVHLVSTDEQLHHLERRPECLVEFDEVLSMIPSHWEHPDDASRGDLYYRSVQLECDAVLSADPEAVAAHLARLLRARQPEGGYRPISADDEGYGKKIRALRLIQLRPRTTLGKFKLGQQNSAAVRSTVVARLRERGEGQDLRAADLASE